MNNKEFFSNGTAAYAAAYGKEDVLERYENRWDYEPKKKIKDPDSDYEPDDDALDEEREETPADDGRVSKIVKEYKAVQAAASRLLSTVIIQARIRELLNALLENEVVDAEHAKLILQDDRLNVKIKAISEYNKLKGRVTEKHEVKGTFSLTELLDAADKAGG